MRWPWVSTSRKFPSAMFKNCYESDRISLYICKIRNKVAPLLTPVVVSVGLVSWNVYHVCSLVRNVMITNIMATNSRSDEINEERIVFDPTEVNFQSFSVFIFTWILILPSHDRMQEESSHSELPTKSYRSQHFSNVYYYPRILEIFLYGGFIKISPYPVEYN
jgi:hypothetical protein